MRCYQIFVIFIMLIIKTATSFAVDYYNKPRSTNQLSTPTSLQLTQMSSKHYFINVTINGKGPFRFMVDTGAPISVISQRLANTLHLEKSKRIKFTRNNKQFNANLYRIPMLKIGNAELIDYDMIVYPEPTIISYFKKEFNEHIDGILGFGAFSDYLITLDFPKKRFILENGQLKPNQQKVSSFNIKEKLPVTSIIFKDGSNHSMQYHFVIDTGSNEQFTLPPMVNFLPYKKTNSQMIKNGTHYGEYTALKEKIVADAYWGDSKFVNPTVVYNKSIYDSNVPFGLMGLEVMDKLKITIDQKKKLIKIE